MQSTVLLPPPFKRHRDESTTGNDNPTPCTTAERKALPTKRTQLHRRELASALLHRRELASALLQVCRLAPVVRYTPSISRSAVCGAAIPLSTTTLARRDRAQGRACVQRTGTRACVRTSRPHALGVDRRRAREAWPQGQGRRRARGSSRQDAPTNPPTRPAKHHGEYRGGGGRGQGHGTNSSHSGRGRQQNRRGDQPFFFFLACSPPSSPLPSALCLAVSFLPRVSGVCAPREWSMCAPREWSVCLPRVSGVCACAAQRSGVSVVLRATHTIHVLTVCALPASGTFALGFHSTWHGMAGLVRVGWVGLAWLAWLGAGGQSGDIGSSGRHQGTADYIA